MKRSQDAPPRRHLLAAIRNMRWKRTLLLVPVMVLLFFGTAIELGHPAASKTRKPGIMAALLEDPLSLFAARSPGGRGAGALLSTKHKLAAAGPEERVLSEERERPPADGTLPGGNNPVFGTAPPDGGAPGGGAPGGDDGILPGGGAPGGGAPGGVPGDGGGGPFSSLPALADNAPQFLQNGPQGTIPTPPPPGSDPPPLDSPPTGPGGPNLNPGLPGIPAVPEPATWAEMIIGFFAIGMAVRRRVRRQARLTCAR
jgi:hypothetical protein